MIAKITGRLVEKKEHSLLIDVQGLTYEVIVPFSVLQRVDESADGNGALTLIIYHYIQIGPSSGTPVLVGFFNEVERDFFMQFIKVSGIGPRAAVKALNKPISEISRAIDENDVATLKTLPGIGAQKAKEIVAKLQGKVGVYGLIQDQGRGGAVVPERSAISEDLEEEALQLLLQLQYKRAEAKDMIHKALQRAGHIRTTEELLNEIYKQRKIT